MTPGIIARLFLFVCLFLFLLVGACALASPGKEAAERTTSRPITDPPALRPLSTERRLVVMLVDNAGSETTDVLVPHGILERSGSVDILIVAAEEGPIELMPALRILPDMTVSEFERAHPQGADAIAVPAFHSQGTEATSAFLRRQAALGAMIVSICEGSEPVARAGLFDGRAATTHWFAQGRMMRRYPEADWVRNARYVIDGPVMSSSGVSASVPVTLALLEILTGQENARTTAEALGLDGWTPEHDSSRFSFNAGTIGLVVANVVRNPRRERLYVDVADGFDGVALALQADAWSRTYRSRLSARNPQGIAVSEEGVHFLTETEGASDIVLSPESGPPFAVLDATLRAISHRYGVRTAELVALQLEYDWPAAGVRSSEKSNRPPDRTGEAFARY